MNDMHKWWLAQFAPPEVRWCVFELGKANSTVYGDSFMAAVNAALEAETKGETQ